VVDCDLRSSNTPSTGDVCGGWNNRDFGSALSASRVNPDIMSGWGVRPVDYQFNISVQQEVIPRMSVEVGYARRNWNNIYYTHSEGLTAAHYQVIDFPIPQHPDLPGGGGGTAQYQIITQAGQSAFPNNIFTNAPEGVDEAYWWHGMDLNVNARLRNGLTIQGGTTTGRGRQNFCGVWAAYPNLVGNNRSLVRYHRELDHQFPGSCLLYDSADRRACQYHHPFDARCRRGRRVHGLCLERLLAERELHRAGSCHHADPRPAACEQRAQHDAQPGQAGRRLPAAH
jgi:hypothetical protein